MKKQKKNILFIVSAGHSGSTFLTKILGQHPNIFPGSELVNFNNTNVRSKKSYCSCGVPYSNCDFWSKIAVKKNIENLQLFSIIKVTHKKNDYIKLFLTIFFKTKFESTTINKNIEDYNNLYSSIFEENNSEIIIDSSKNFFNALILASQDVFDYQFIFLKRDGRAVLNSYMKPNYTANVKGKSATHKRNVGDPSHVVYYWMKQNILGILLKMVRSKKTITVKHEDLIQNTTVELERIFKKINLSNQTQLIEFKKEVHLFGGNSSRMNTKNINRKDLQSWRKNLSDEHLKSFNTKAKIINFILGYR